MYDQSTAVDSDDEFPIGNQQELARGTKIGPWEIDKLTATGGHGAVYRVNHVETGALGALKTLHPLLSLVPRMVERFLREVEVIFRLEHPNIIRILEVGELPDGVPYYVMEYIEGKTLRTLLDENGRLSPPETLALLEPICLALEAAHGKGVVHRDVKASNIMITLDAPLQVKLLDFGIAKLMTPNDEGKGFTTVGRQVGTPSAMAPEQIIGGEVDQRTDIYALGALLYQMMTGRRPFESTTFADLARLHLEAPPPRPSERVPVSPAFDAIVARAMDKRQQNRYSTVGAFLDAVRQAVYGSTTIAPASADRYAVGLFVDIRPRLSSEADEDTFDTVAALTVEYVEEIMKQGGLCIAMCTSNTILGVRVLDGKPSESQNVRHAVLARARTIRNTVARETNVHVNLCLHVDRVTVCQNGSGELEITSGVIARTETWAPTINVNGMCATPEFVGGLEDMALKPGPGGLFIVDDKECASMQESMFE
jgi:eukaryotic-like serine/threonine-protein kinase